METSTTEFRDLLTSIVRDILMGNLDPKAVDWDQLLPLDVEATSVSPDKDLELAGYPLIIILPLIIVSTILVVLLLCLLVCYFRKRRIETVVLQTRTDPPVAGKIFGPTIEGLPQIETAATLSGSQERVWQPPQPRKTKSSIAVESQPARHWLLKSPGVSSEILERVNPVYLSDLSNSCPSIKLKELTFSPYRITYVSPEKTAHSDSILASRATVDGKLLELHARSRLISRRSTIASLRRFAKYLARGARSRNTSASGTSSRQSHTGNHASRGRVTPAAPNNTPASDAGLASAKKVKTSRRRERSNSRGDAIQSRLTQINMGNMPSASAHPRAAIISASHSPYCISNQNTTAHRPLPLHVKNLLTQILLDPSAGWAQVRCEDLGVSHAHQNSFPNSSYVVQSNTAEASLTYTVDPNQNQGRGNSKSSSVRAQVDSSESSVQLSSDRMEEEHDSAGAYMAETDVDIRETLSTSLERYMAPGASCYQTSTSYNTSVPSQSLSSIQPPSHMSLMPPPHSDVSGYPQPLTSSVREDETPHESMGYVEVFPPARLQSSSLTQSENNCAMLRPSSMPCPPPSKYDSSTDVSHVLNLRVPSGRASSATPRLIGRESQSIATPLSANFEWDCYPFITEVYQIQSESPTPLRHHTNVRTHRRLGPGVRVAEGTMTRLAQVHHWV